MRKHFNVILAFGLASPIMAMSLGAAQAAPAPSLIIVHGIEGSDLGPAYLPSFPINVQIDGTCVTAAPVQFGTVLGPYPLAAGPHRVAISPADTISPCANTPVLSRDVSFGANSQYALVAAESTTGAPTTEVFNLLESAPVGSGRTRVLVANAADAPTVDVTLTEDTTGTVTTLSGIAPIHAKTAGVMPFTGYGVRVLPSGSSSVIAGPVSFSGWNRALEALFVVGNAANGTVTVISKEIPAIF